MFYTNRRSPVKRPRNAVSSLGHAHIRGYHESLFLGENEGDEQQRLRTRAPLATYSSASVTSAAGPTRRT